MKNFNFVKYFGTMLLAAFFIGVLNITIFGACNINESTIAVINLCSGGLIGWFWPNIYSFLGLDK